MKALSIVFPGGTNIAQGHKKIEVRSWKPALSADEDLLIVESKVLLGNEGEFDPHGVPIAIVRVRAVREFIESDMAAACTSRWQAGLYSWVLTDVRPILDASVPIVAMQGIYEVDWPSRNEMFESSVRSLESAIELKLQLTPEERIEAHENARKLMVDLQEAGRTLRFRRGRVVSIDDLIRVKESMKRPKDLQAVEELRLIQRESTRGSSPEGA